MSAVLSVIKPARGGQGGPRLSDRTRDSVIAEVAERHAVRPADIMGKGRARCYSRPRQEVMYLLRVLGFSQPEVARSLGLANHTTVWHAERAHKARMIARDPDREAA